MRKGISPLVAAVLLIAVTMTIAGILSYWASSYVRGRLEEKQNETIMIECSGADFDIYSVMYDNSTHNLTLILHNKQLIPLKDLKVTFFYSTGVEEKRLDKPLPANSYVSYVVSDVKNYTKFIVSTHCPGVEAEYP